MIPALRAILRPGWVEYRGPHYDFEPLQMNPAPKKPVPIYGGGHSEPAMRRAAALCDGWIAAGAYSEDDAWHHLRRLREELARAGRASEPFTIYMALGVPPDVEVYKRFEDAGVTDLVCAPWMLATASKDRDYRSDLDAKLRASEEFATRIIQRI
jgi:alkanesulfonate monooxygenase SsuD/methylene tetrahydromethanopterin reductase-like flavin-dependent oxidoreductase (luciferase family)